MNKTSDISHYPDSDYSADTAALQQKGLYRTERIITTRSNTNIVVDGKALTNFCSNDYLGLACDPRIARAMSEAAEEFGVGSGASPLVSGKTEWHQRLEAQLALMTGRDRALLMPCGYMANLAIISGLVTSRHNEVIGDRLCHASMLDGAAVYAGRLRRYRHGSPGSLESLLSSSKATKKLVLTESVFSMDGDIAPLPELVSVCNDYRACLVVDDAHGFGVLGNNGLGGLDYFSLGQTEVPVLMATFGKALGVSGAFVAGPDSLIESLVQRARPYIYSTSLPVPVVAAVIESLAIQSVEGGRRQKLKALIGQFRSGAKARGINLLKSVTPIQPVLIGDANQSLGVSRRLEQQGLFVRAIRPPTVPAGTSRLRITISAAHTPAQIDRLLDSLEECL